jgi:hypothetical protein
MDEDKYYTPEIQEFYVGFEYETYNDRCDSWMHSFYETGHDARNSPLNELDMSKERVKHLDEDDIKSLGCKHVAGGKLNDKTIQFFSKLTSKGYWVHLKIIFFSDIAVIGVEVSVEEESERTLIVHSIIIKNKSELKKLMKQLNIEL